MNENKNRKIIILIIVIAIVASAILAINIFSSKRTPQRTKPFAAPNPLGPPPLPPETELTENQKILKQIQDKFNSSKRESVPQPPNIVFEIGF